MTITNPRSFQAVAITTAGMAHAGSVHHPGPSIPTRPSTLLTTPPEGSSSHFHVSATTTHDVTTGRKYSERKTAIARTPLLSARAIPRPPVKTSGRYIPRKEKVCPTAAQNSPSPTSWP